MSNPLRTPRKARILKRLKSCIGRWERATGIFIVVNIIPFVSFILLFLLFSPEYLLPQLQLLIQPKIFEKHVERCQLLSYFAIVNLQPMLEKRPLKANIPSSLIKERLLDSQEHKFPEMDLFGEWRVTGYLGA